MSVFVASAAWSIVRENVAGTTFRAGSDAMCRHEKRQSRKDKTDRRNSPRIHHILINLLNIDLMLTVTHAKFGLGTKMIAITTCAVDGPV